MKKRFLGLVALALALVALVGCAQPGGGDSGADSFVGTWLYTSDNYSTIEFKTDGTFLWNNGGLEITGTYVVDGNEATLTSATYDGEPVVTTLGTATIDGNTLKFLGGEFIRQ
ncbi:MAG: hypothetical protein IKW26_08780 [Treponema sp.]|nr:hypothetical protein [Treponema sp.]